MLSIKDPLLYPSGVNSSFHNIGGDFQDYITQMQSVITAGRLDLTPENYNQVLAAISPFELRPAVPSKKGLLLIHGLYDSPFTWHDLAPQLVNAGYLVRSILLPGHGTVPGDLLTVKYEEWLKAADFGIRSFKGKVSEIYVIAFSIGSPIAIQQAFKHPQIKAMVLIAPALKPRRFAANFTHILTWLGNFYQPYAWYQRAPQHLFVKYESFTCNAANQFCLLIKKTHQLLKKATLAIPLLVIASADDETVSEKAIVDFFLRQPNPNNHLLIYGNMPEPPKDERVQHKSSLYTDQKILDFSHISLAIAPNNPNLGSDANYHDFQHYEGKIPESDDIYQGAVKVSHLKKKKLRRLTYNPDFDFMAKMILDFLRMN